MASITERKGRYLVRVRRDGFDPVTKTFTRKQDAAAWGRKVEAGMEAGTWHDDRHIVPTLKEVIPLYRAAAVAKLKGAATYAYWFDELALSCLAGKRVDQITPPDLSAWRDVQQKGGLKPGTVVRKMGLLSGLLTWCHRERGWLTSNPMRSVSKPRVNDARDRILSDEELACLQAAAQSSRATWLGDALIVLVRSAMRRGELWGLKVADVDFARSTAHLADSKNNSSRDVPLCPMAREALQRLVVAASSRGSTSLIPVTDPAAISLAFRRTLARARREYAKRCTIDGNRIDPAYLANVRLHDMRHVAVSAWAATGKLSLIELAAISGHRSLKSLARYSHLSSERVAAKMATLNA